MERLVKRDETEQGTIQSQLLSDLQGAYTRSEKAKQKAIPVTFHP